jgi:homoaconitase/3-isopropylmalate dehydratase large subunit
MRKGATLAQKILSYHLGREVKVGEIISIPVDLIFAHDGTAPLAIQTFYELPPLDLILKYPTCSNICANLLRNMG